MFKLPVIILLSTATQCHKNLQNILCHDTPALYQISKVGTIQLVIDDIILYFLSLNIDRILSTFSFHYWIYFSTFFTGQVNKSTLFLKIMILKNCFEFILYWKNFVLMFVQC